MRRIEAGWIRKYAELDRVVLMDFGLAVMDGKGGGDSSGTPAFMAPEQVSGTDVDRRADLYALGCVIYYMMTGDVVFPAESAAVMMQRHLVDPPPPLPDAPAWLAKLVRRLLAKDPAERPSAADVVVALGGPRRRWLFAVVAVIACAGAAAVWLLTRPAPEWHPIVRDMGPQYEEYATGPVWSPDGTQIAYASDRSGVSRIYVESVADGTSHPIGPPDLGVWVPRWARDGRAIYAGDYGGANNLYRIEPRDGAVAVNLGPLGWFDDCGHGRWLYAGPAHNAIVMREADGREHDVLGAPVGVAALHCDSTGEHAVYTRVIEGIPQIWWLSLADGQTRMLVPEGFVAGMHPDGRSVIVTLTRDGKQNLWEVPVDGGEPLQLTFGDGPDTSADVSPDGRQLAFTSGHPAWANTQVYACTIATGAARKLTSQVEAFTDLVVTPDGSFVIAADDHDGKHVIVAISARNGGQHVIVEGRTPTLTRDGRELIYSVGNGPTSIYAMPIDGGEKRVITTIASEVGLVRVDDRGVVHICDRSHTWRVPLGGGRLEIEVEHVCVVPAPVGAWAVAMASESATIIGPGQRVGDPNTLVVHEISPENTTWSRDGTAVLYTDPHGALRRIDVATHSDSVISETCPGDLSGMALSPDGTTLYVARSDTHTRRHILTNFGDRPRPR